jgi:methionine synthase II (cobalamin-independent)
MFSTLLGSLPPMSGDLEGDSDPERSTDGDLARLLGELAGTGLELLATGRPASAARDADEVVAEWRAASAATDRPVKQVVLGPYSEGRDGDRDQPIVLAERGRTTIAALIDAGCPFIEVAEPDALAIAVAEPERRRFAEAHRTLVDGISGTHLSLAMTGGNLDAAGPATFFDRPYASFAFDLIAGPDNWRLIALAPGDRGIVCGALDPAARGDETPELLVWAAHYAASTGGRGLDRIGLANAPSLADGSWDVALRKLRRLAEATRIASVESSEEMAGLLDRRAFGGRRNRPGVVRLTRPDEV